MRLMFYPLTQITVQEKIFICHPITFVSVWYFVRCQIPFANQEYIFHVRTSKLIILCADEIVRQWVKD